MDADPSFESKPSSASCYVSDIKDFIFGGMTSRIWMLRKHFNSMSLSEISEVPFHSWQCITLILEHRDVDLIISDESDMLLILKFLIHNLYTLDGERDSARPLLNALQK
jgi:hypothetical protein